MKTKKDLNYNEMQSFRDEIAQEHFQLPCENGLAYQQKDSWARGLPCVPFAGLFAA